MKEAVAKKVFGAPEEGSMCYMMSKQGYLNDGAGHWHPHPMPVSGDEVVGWDLRRDGGADEVRARMSGIADVSVVSGSSCRSG